MKAINQRIHRIEARLNPQTKPKILVVTDLENGTYTGKEPGSGEPDRIYTGEDLEALGEDWTVIVIRYAPMDASGEPIG